MNATRRKAETVPLRTITAASSVGTYKPNWVPVRTGSQDHEKVPSRQGSSRFYRDGKVEAA